MGEETARLRAEIDQTRDDLTRDVDLLAEKTSPSKIVERRVQRTKRGIAGLKDKLMGSMPGSDDDDERYGYGYYGDTRYGESQGMTGNVRSAVAGGASTASSAVSSAKDSVTGAASSAAGTVQDAASSVGDAASSTLGTVREQTEGNPLAAGLVAFGVGWLVSSLLPASEAERRAARRAVEQAKEQGQPVIEQAKQVAQDVGQHMQEQAGQAAQQVKERAQDATATVKDEAQSASQDVKQTATGAAQDVRDQTQQHVEEVRSGSGSSSGGSPTSTY